MRRSNYQAKNRIFGFFTALILLCVMYSSGCALRSSYYDPAGKTLFQSGNSAATAPVPAPSGATLGNDAPPPATSRLAPAVAADSSQNIVRGNDPRSTQVVPAVSPERVSVSEPFDLILGPPQIVAIPGAEVIFVAGVRDIRGYLRMNQPIQWSISRESVGHFVNLEGRNWRNLLVGDFTVPKIESDTLALTTTSRTEQVLDMGTPTTDDDIRILRGQTWISVSSPREGITWLTASNKNIADADRRTRTARVLWVDAEFKLPESRVIDFGGRYTMVTELRRRSNATPLVNWRVRYEIPAGAAATFPDGTKVLEVLTDARGKASIEILQPISRAEDTDVSIQIIRPAEAGTGFTEPVIVQQSKVRYRWAPNTITIQKTLPQNAYIGETVPGTITVANLTAEPINRVRITDLSPEGFTLVDSTPRAVPAVDGAQWTLETLGPHKTYVIQVWYRVDRPGTYLTVSRVTVDKLGNQLTVESTAAISAGEPTSPYLPEKEPEKEVRASEGESVRDPFTVGGSTSALSEPPAGGETGTGTAFSGVTEREAPPAARTYEIPAGGSEGYGASGPAAGDMGAASSAEIGPASEAPQIPAEEPADAPIHLSIIAPAVVRLHDEITVKFAILNRLVPPDEPCDIFVKTTPGLVHEKEKNGISPRSMGPLGNELKVFTTQYRAEQVGEQTITVWITNESKTISYTREARIRVINPMPTALSDDISGGSTEMPPSSPPVPASEKASAFSEKTSASSEKERREPLSAETLLSKSGTEPGIFVEGPAEAKKGETVLFSIYVMNPTPREIADLKIQLESAAELELYRATENLQRPSAGPAFWMCNMPAKWVYHYRVEFISREAGRGLRNRVTLFSGGKIIAEKDFTLDVNVDTGSAVVPVTPITSPPVTPVNPPAGEEKGKEGLSDLELPVGGASTAEITPKTPPFPENALPESVSPDIFGEKPFSTEKTDTAEPARTREIPGDFDFGNSPPEKNDALTVGDILHSEKESLPESPLTVEFTQSVEKPRVGEPFSYNVLIKNTSEEPVSRVFLILVFPPDTLKSQKSQIKMPENVTVEEEDAGVLNFTDVAELPPGETLTYQVPVTAIIARVAEAQVWVTDSLSTKAGGKPMKKFLETKIGD